MNAREIIAKAIELHADEFRAAMIKQAETHSDMMHSTANSRARDGARAQLNACLNVYDAIAGGIDRIPSGDLDAICNIMSNCIIALNAACKLLGIDPAARTKAIVDWEEAQHAAGIWR